MHFVQHARVIVFLALGSKASMEWSVLCIAFAFVVARCKFLASLPAPPKTSKKQKPLKSSPSCSSRKETSEGPASEQSKQASKVQARCKQAHRQAVSNEASHRSKQAKVPHVTLAVETFLSPSFLNVFDSEYRACGTRLSGSFSGMLGVLEEILCSWGFPVQEWGAHPRTAFSHYFRMRMNLQNV